MYAEDEEITTTVTKGSEDTHSIVDLIWIMDDIIKIYGSDGRFLAEISSKIQFEIYIIDRYDEANWRVYAQMIHEPERVLLIPVEGNDKLLISYAFTISS